VCMQVGQEITDKRTMHACHKNEVEQSYNIKIASKFFKRQ
jgi:stress-induced morphogen